MTKREFEPDKPLPPKELDELENMIHTTTLSSTILNNRLKTETFARVYLALYFCYKSKKIGWKFTKKQFLVIYNNPSCSSNSVLRILMELRDFGLLAGGIQAGVKSFWHFNHSFFNDKYYTIAKEALNSINGKHKGVKP